MADFERLIRGALASQDASSPQVRQVIYQSSRNALQKIIDSNRSLTVEAVMAQKRKLEESIEGIEAEFNPPPAPVAPATPPQPEPVIEQQQQISEPEVQSQIFEEPAVIQPSPDEFIAPPVTQTVGTPANPEVDPAKPEPKVEQPDDPLFEIQQILESTSPKAPQQTPAVDIEQVVSEVAPEPPVAPQPEPIATPQPALDEINVQPQDPALSTPVQSDEYYQSEENVPLGFSKRRKKQRRLFWTLIVLVIIGMLAWIAYTVFNNVINSALLANNDNGPKLNPNAISRQADAENYITVINADDLSALNTAGNGRAQIVNQLNSNMIRVSSARDALNRSEPAAPMLIRLKPGVLKQISGKRVTVELFAKSGANDSAHFAVGCEFGTLTECGRKRFLAGSQPNASVFAFQMDEVSDINQEMFLTLSTDTTSEAAVTGKGDVLDIVYIRLAVEN